MTSYSLKLYHSQSKKYEYLGEVQAENQKEAIKKFRKKSQWNDVPDTILFAQPPICR